MEKIKQYSLLTLETIINKLISLDIHTKKKLTSLNNKEIVMEISNLNLEIFAWCQDSHIHLTFHSSRDTCFAPAVKISGTSKKLLKLLLLKNTDNPLVGSLQGVSIAGDLESAKLLQEIINELEIDWEEQLSLITGDIVAHQIGNFVRNTNKRLQRTSNSLQEMFAEYILYEAKLAPTNNEVDNFIRDVDDIRNATDRLEAMVNILEKKIEN